MKKYLLHIIAIIFIASFGSCDTARWPIDEEPGIKIDTKLLGQWRVKNKHEEFTLIKETDFMYTILYKDWRTGDLQQFPAFLSEVKGARFLNVNLKDQNKEGYLFVRILDINSKTNVVTACAYTDSLFQIITEPADVRNRITDNIDNPANFSDTTYFYRIIR